MERCISCGKATIMPEYLGAVAFCKVCSLKIQLPFWKNKLFENSNKLQKQKEHVLASAINKGFSNDAIRALTNYFEAEENKGFIGAIDGGFGQTLRAYRDYSIINTDENLFNIDEMSKSYAQILRSTETHMGFFDDPKIQSTLVNSLLKGRIVETGIGLAKSAAIDAAMGGIFPQKSKIQVVFGDRFIQYKDYSDVELVNIGNSEPGCLRFYNQSREVLFFFNSNTVLKKRVSSLYKSIHECFVERVTKQGNMIKANQVDSFEAIRKYKALLDEGIISQEEFEQKKRELLNL